MRKLSLSLLSLLATVFFVAPVTAQETDSTLALPDAKPGECYAKVITPARFETRSEEIVVQEASERIETIEAQYEKAQQSVLIRESEQLLEASDAAFANQIERVEVAASQKMWTSDVTGETLPASPDAIEHIARSGIELDSVEPGSCYVEYFRDAEYKIERQRVMVKEASEKITITPAKFETIQERIIVREASIEVVDVPAVYRTQTESVLVEPASSVWQSDCGMVEQVDNATGEVLCLVEVPARYETLTKTVLDTPATTKTINIPAVYKTVDVERIVQPASEKRETIPAEYTTVEQRVKVSDPVFFWLAKGADTDDGVKATGREICLTQQPAEYENVTKAVVSQAANLSASVAPARYQTVEIDRLVSPATERRIVIPARTRTVTSQVEIAPARVEWKKVLCRANMTPELVTELQRALRREGFDPGPIDGIFGNATLRAIERFQVEEGIDQGGITYEALTRLKVQS